MMSEADKELAGATGRWEARVEAGSGEGEEGGRSREDGRQLAEVKEELRRAVEEGRGEQPTPGGESGGEENFRVRFEYQGSYAKNMDFDQAAADGMVERLGMRSKVRVTTGTQMSKYERGEYSRVGETAAWKAYGDAREMLKRRRKKQPRMVEVKPDFSKGEIKLVVNGEMIYSRVERGEKQEVRKRFVTEFNKQLNEAMGRAAVVEKQYVLKDCAKGSAVFWAMEAGAVTASAVGIISLPQAMDMLPPLWPLSGEQRAIATYLVGLTGWVFMGVNTAAGQRDLVRLELEGGRRLTFFDALTQLQEMVDLPDFDLKDLKRRPVEVIKGLNGMGIKMIQMVGEIVRLFPRYGAYLLKAEFRKPYFKDAEDFDVFGQTGRLVRAWLGAKETQLVREKS